jgi:lipopolysaccharide/colanic/teichoic acid biosynthesis glycosyltransferase
MVTIPAALSLATLILVAYHHLLYPALSWVLSRPNRARRRRGIPASAYRHSRANSSLPSIAVLILSESGDEIAATIRSLAALDYPAGRLDVLVASESSRSTEAVLARATAMEPACRHLHLRVLTLPTRHSGAALLGELLPILDAEIVALAESGSLVSVDGLLVAAWHFEDPQVGMVRSTCRSFEGRIRSQPALVVGQGFDLLRRDLLRPLPAGTIDGEMTIRLKLLQRGYRIILDERIAVPRLRLPPTAAFGCRCRAAAGALQEVLRHRRLLHPRHGRLAFAFASGEVLHVATPFLIGLSLAGCLVAAPDSVALAAPAGLLGLLYAVAALRHQLSAPACPRRVEHVLRILDGHMAGLVGGMRYLFGLERTGPRGATAERSTPIALTPRGPSASARPTHIHLLVAVGKRTLDITVAFLLLALAAPLFPAIALVIKLDSRGPVFFRQMRIGESSPKLTKLFHIIKFRTMRADAEAGTGAVLASKNDPRVTRVGRFLRRTRLDELPQLVNVLRGEMSLVGPRPERPGIFRWLDIAIPYYGERMYGVKPGITGFAQVVQGYDETIDDVRSKLNLDHAYALSLSRPGAWLTLELSIIARTFLVMVRRAGQ